MVNLLVSEKTSFLWKSPLLLRGWGNKQSSLYTVVCTTPRRGSLTGRSPEKLNGTPLPPPPPAWKSWRTPCCRARDGRLSPSVSGKDSPHSSFDISYLVVMISWKIIGKEELPLLSKLFDISVLDIDSQETSVLYFRSNILLPPHISSVTLATPVMVSILAELTQFTITVAAVPPGVIRNFLNNGSLISDRASKIDLGSPKLELGIILG